jgi:methionine synthase II (cobalamin-independent)
MGPAGLSTCQRLASAIVLDQQPREFGWGGISAFANQARVLKMPYEAAIKIEDISIVDRGYLLYGSFAENLAADDPSDEAANPRHEHEWRLWQNVKLPADKVLMPGLITHSTNVIEHPELIAERLLRFVDRVGRENVMAGSDCGFSQSPLCARVHRSIMWAKLRSLAAGAGIAAKEAWGK